MRIYDKVRSLADTMVDSNKANERRNAANELIQLINQSEIRKQLAATAKVEVRFQALCELWRLMVQNSIHYVESFQRSKAKTAKLQPTDLSVPKQILVECDRANEGIDCPDPRTQMCKLSKNSIKQVIRFVLELLRNETLQEDDFQDQILDLLVYICSQRYYVAYMRPDREIKLVFEAIEERLLGDEYSDRCRTKSAQAFASLLNTTAKMNMNLNLVLAGCVKTVWKYIKKMKGTRDIIFTDMNLIRGLSDLLRSEPEQSIAPISRFGDMIYKAVKKQYEKSSAPATLAVCEEFFIRFLQVYQAAGVLQGYHIGDFGYMGKRTLDQRVVKRLLESVLMKVESESKGTGRTNESFPLDTARRTRLDLLARLFAVAQRQHLCEQLWETVDDPTEYVLEQVHKQISNPSSDDWKKSLEDRLSPKQCRVRYMHSPIVKTLLAPFLNLERGRDIRKFVGDSEFLWSVLSSIEHRTGDTELPMLDLLSSTKILVAASEIFPYSPFLASTIRIESFGLDSESLKLATSGPADLAIVVHLLGDSLEAQGSIFSDQCLLEWTLLCLDRLAVSTAVCKYSDEAGGKSLRSAWRRIWDIIFRQDLIFRPIMNDGSSFAVQDALFGLLVQITFYGCTDYPGSQDSRPFTYDKQSDVWSLSVFSDASKVVPDSIFMLVLALANRGGVSGHGTDMIMKGQPVDVPRIVRLFDFCSKKLERTEVSGSRLASLCLSCLIRGASIDFLLDTSNGIFSPATLISTTIDTDVRDQNCAIYSSSLFPGFVSKNTSWVACLFENTPENPLESGYINAAGDLLSDDPVYYSATLVYREITQQMESLFILDSGRESNSRILSQTLVSRASSFEFKESLTWERGLSNLISWTKILLSVSARPSLQDASLESFTLSFLEEAIEILLTGVRARPPRGCSLVCQLVECLVAVPESALELSRKISLRILEEELVDLLKWFQNYAPDDLALLSTAVSGAVGEDEDFAESNGHRKRLRRNEVSSSKRMKVSDTIEADSITRETLSAAKALRCINPSLKTCEFILRSLAFGRSDISGWSCLSPKKSFLAASAVRLVCSQSSLVQEYEMTGTTIRQLVCRGILAIREAAGPFDFLDLFGFDLCATMLNGRLHSISVPILKAEIQAVLALLLPTAAKELRSLSMSSLIKAHQILAGCFIFENEASEVHECLDADYPKHFVIAPLRDLSGRVRRAAIKALHVAMKMLPAEKVIESLKSRFSLLMKMREGNDPRDVYTKWYCNHASIAEDVSVGEKQAWEDSFFSFGGTILGIFKVLAEWAPSLERRLELLIDIVNLSTFTKIELSYSTHSVLQSIAKMRSLAEIGPWTLHQAVQRVLARKLKLSYLPVSALMPRLLSLCVDTGRASCGCDAGEKTLDWDIVEERVSQEYVVRYVHLFVASLLACHVQEDDSSPSFLEKYLIQEIVSLFEDEDTSREKVISSLLEHSIPDILALFSILRAEWGWKEDVKSIVSKALVIAPGRISLAKTADTLKKRALLSLFQYASQSSFFRLKGSEETFSETCLSILNLSARDSVDAVDSKSLSCIGTSILECLLALSEVTFSSFDKYSTPVPIIGFLANMVVREISSGECSHWTLRFYLKYFARLCSHNCFTNVGTFAMQTFFEVFVSALRSHSKYSFWNRMAHEIRYSIALIFCLQEQARQSLACKSSQLNSVDHSAESLYRGKEHQFSRRFVENYDSESLQTVINMIDAFLSDLASSHEELGLSLYHFSGLWAVNRHPETGFMSKHDEVSTPTAISISVLESFMIFSTTREPYDAVEEMIILGELNAVDTIAFDCLSGPLVHKLFRLCGPRFPSPVREAASRCIGNGEILIRDVDLKEDFRVASSEASNDVFGNFITALVTCLNSPTRGTPERAFKACLQLSSIPFSTSMFSHNGDIKALFRTINPGGVKDAPSAIGSRLDLVDKYSDKSHEPDDWESIWLALCREDLTENEWTCRFVSSLIIWYYGTDSKESGAGDVFGPCVELAATDSFFARNVLPVLCITLLKDETLRSGREETESRTNAKDSPRALLSFCFSNIMSTILSESLLVLFIDTLDAIFQSLLQQFSETSAKKNPTTIEKALSYGYVPSEDEFRAALEDPRETVGPKDALVPYKNVLSIPAVTVAKACARVRRFASCIFHLEFEEASRHLSDLMILSSVRSGEGSTALDLLENAYLELDDIDNHELVRSMKNNRDVSTVPGTFTDVPLRVADGVSNFLQDQVERKLVISEKLESEGLYSALQTYIKGVYADHKAMLSDEQNSVLEERWNKASMNSILWNTGSMEPDVEIGISSTLSTSYQSSFASLIDSYRRDDSLPTLIESVRKARFHLLETLSSQMSPEAPPSSLAGFRGFIRTFDEFEMLLRNKLSIEGLHRRWLGADSGSRSSSFNTLTSSGREVIPDTLREIILASSLSRQPRQSVEREYLSTFMLEKVRWNCDNNRIDEAESCLYRLKNYSKKEIDNSGSWLKLEIENARIAERRGDFKKGIQKLRDLIARHKDSASRSGGVHHLEDYARAMLLCGKWQSEYKTQPANVAIQEFLKPAIHLLETSKREGKPARQTLVREAWLILGKTSANVFNRSKARFESKDWQRKSALLAERKSQLDDYKGNSTKKRKSTPTKLEILLAREVERLEDEESRAKRSIEEYGMLAAESSLNYLKSVGYSASADTLGIIYRSISLWFEMTVDDSSQRYSFPRAKRVFEEGLVSIQSACFVPVASQLFSRVQDSDSDFQEQLSRLIFRLCSEHPYHCIPNLLSLVNGNRVHWNSKAPEVSTFIKNRGMSRVEKSSRILNKLRKQGDYISTLTEAYEATTDAYIFLALKPIEKDLDLKQIPMSHISNKTNERLDYSFRNIKKSIRYLPAVYSHPLPIRPGGDYLDSHGDLNGGEIISEFSKTFSLTEGGIHRPKIIICKGSQGTSFRELVKGEDDVRKDAIMQQIFDFVNVALQSSHRNGAAGIRNASLRIHTYKIVPFTPQCGLLQWVEETAGFGEYVTGRGNARTGAKSGAASRYYPGQLGSRLCRTLFEETVTAPDEIRRRRYEAICRNFSPVYRFFFIERFGHDFAQWFQARRRYTLSVAVTSIIGHILGIGDRHAANILVHQKTGEVVHIDFGICFEEGKHNLTVPELVPFRLTPNIVDGFGPLGVEGSFALTCEATMKALRDHTYELLVLLTAIVADPLYRWSVSPLQARKVQQDEEADVDDEAISTEKEKTNEDAERVMTRIREKLQGYEDGIAGEQQGVEGQVQFVINASRDPGNLSKMYYGWAPWL